MRPLRPRLSDLVIGELAVGDATRQELCEWLDVSRTSLGRAIDEIAAEGAFISSVKESAGSRGRPVERLHFNSQVGYRVGIEISRSSCCAVVLNRHYDVLATVTLDIDDFQGWHEPLKCTSDMLYSTAERQHVQMQDISRVGVGIPVPLGTDSPEYSQVLDEVRTVIERRWNAPTLVENTVRLAAIGENGWGASKGYGSYVYVRFGAGLGCCVVISDQITHGQAGYAGELGHVHVSGLTDPCYCGGTGCLETVASSRALCEAAGVPHLAQLGAAYARHDKRACTAIERAVSMVGNVLASLVLTASPQVVLCAGEVVDAIPDFPQLLRKAILDSLSPMFHEIVTVQKASLGKIGSALGAALAANYAVDESDTESGMEGYPA